jgi:hypothetical protein
MITLPIHVSRRDLDRYVVLFLLSVRDHGTRFDGDCKTGWTLIPAKPRLLKVALV